MTFLEFLKALLILDQFSMAERELNKEKTAYFSAKLAIIDRKFLLRLLSQNEWIVEFVKYAVEVGVSSRKARKLANSAVEKFHRRIERSMREDRALSFDVFMYGVGRCAYETDLLVGRFLRGEVPRSDMLNQMVEINRRIGLSHDMALRLALKTWEEWEPIWTDKSYIHIPLPPPNIDDETERRRIVISYRLFGHERWAP
jgi:hypothetical protein